MRYNQCGAIGLGDDIGHREGFAAARDTQQYLMRKVLFQAGRQLRDRTRLIAGGDIRLMEFEHAAS